MGDPRALYPSDWGLSLGFFGSLFIFLVGFAIGLPIVILIGIYLYHHDLEIRKEPFRLIRVKNGKPYTATVYVLDVGLYDDNFDETDYNKILVEEKGVMGQIWVDAEDLF